MQEDTLYRHILKEAWRLTWHNKLLWVLGFFSVFWGGVGAYGVFNRALEKVGPALPPLSEPQGLLRPPFEALSTGWFATLLFVALVVAAIFFAFIILITAARGGLIFAVERRFQGKAWHLREALRRGTEAFWPLLAIGILIRLDLILYALAVEPLTSAPATPARVILYVLAFIIVTLISMTLSFLGIYAAAQVMLQGASLWRAIKESLQLFIRHWLVSFELALIMYMLALLVGIAVLAVLFAVAVPFALLAFILSFLQVPGGMWLAIVPAAAVYIALLILAGSVFVTYQYTLWTLLYLRLREHGAVAKVVRITARFGHILHKKLV